MKPVYWEEKLFGRWGFKRDCPPDFEYDLRAVLTGWKVRRIEAFRVRYDNGQLCTFRRKA